jgi:polysaccharide lyase-like protein
MPGRTRLACLTVVLALAAAGAGAGEAHALTLKRLDYESGNFGQWTAVQAVSGGARIVRSPVRQGRYAARFVVRPGDDPIPSSGERAEVMAYTRETEGVESWWHWSTYFPTGFRANRGAWNVFTQWHQTGANCQEPVQFAVNNYLSPARLRLYLNTGSLNLSTCHPGFIRAWNFAVLRRNRWYNFTFHVKWSSKGSVGFVQLWMNGRQVIRLTHVPTLYQGQGVYVKQGFYRGHSSRTTTIYHDGLRRYVP